MKRIDQIILVDNDHRVTSVVQKGLEEAGFAENIKIAVNGEHALLCLEHLDLYKRIRGKKTMIILSIDTPLVNGISFLESFKNKKYSSDEVLVIITDNTARENIEKAFTLGVTEVLSSPLKVSDIVEVGTKYFASKPQRERLFTTRKSESQRISA